MTHHCWKQIGVWGDRSCPELQGVIHCHNCSIYASAGRSLLEREAVGDYLDEWTHLLADRDADTKSDLQNTISAVIFRLGGEWLALPTLLFKEITEMRVVHTLPHRSNEVLLGVVNIRGETQLCISLEGLLKITPLANGKQNINQLSQKRLVVVEKETHLWVFPVDEFEGVYRVHQTQFRNVPATVSHVKDTFTKAMISWRDRGVSYLDEELLFYTLNRKVL